MRKTIALPAALGLLLLLTGCSLFKPDILGTYEMEVDLRESVIGIFDSGTELTDSGYSLDRYLPAFKLNILFEFREDETYRITADHASIQAAVQTLQDAAAEMTDEYLFHTLKQQYAPYGITVETVADVEALIGMSWDELYVAALGESRTDYISHLVSDSFAGALTADYCSEGQFTARKGQLHLSEALDLEPSEEIYETYEKGKDSITFTGAVNLESNRRITYPYVITAVN